MNLSNFKTQINLLSNFRRPRMQVKGFAATGIAKHRRFRPCYSGEFDYRKGLLALLVDCDIEKQKFSQTQRSNPAAIEEGLCRIRSSLGFRSHSYRSKVLPTSGFSLNHKRSSLKDGIAYILQDNRSHSLYRHSGGALSENPAAQGNWSRSSAVRSLMWRRYLQRFAHLRTVGVGGTIGTELPPSIHS
jgi:hypothetical protein